MKAKSMKYNGRLNKIITLSRNDSLIFYTFSFKFTSVCLAIPGKINSIEKKTNTASVDFDGIERDVNISLVEVKKGDYVIVHAGYAIQKIDQEEALKTIKLYETGKRLNQK